ncbi:hypothetical protein [Evansella clarkii]|uniref:hypothetical protein n=1 Tax=Evansella clarkii TaxID=79879 RepID=UPI001F386FEF|nr:hypothetical protein [Evansella clarkii]
MFYVGSLEEKHLEAVTLHGKRGGFMFGLSDIPTFIWAIFISLPVVSLIHEAGHYLTARIFGGKLKFTIGQGKVIFQSGDFEIRRVFFLDSWCQVEELNVSNKFSHALVYAGGVLFNLLSIFIVNSLLHLGIFQEHIFFYQFVYFSLYYMVYALIPVEVGKGNPTDGKAIYDVLKHGINKDPLD